MPIHVVASDPRWKLLFEAEARQLQRALGDGVTIHHVGSTAVPGLSAKPIIDILLDAADIHQLDVPCLAMEMLGYEGLGEFGITGRRYFRKDNSAGIRTHHVHAFQRGDPEIERHLAFRDYLRAHPDVASAYGELKQTLAKQHADDRDAYMDGKDPFIKEHERRALGWRKAGGWQLRTQ